MRAASLPFRRCFPPALYLPLMSNNSEKKQFYITEGTEPESTELKPLGDAPVLNPSLTPEQEDDLKEMKKKLMEASSIDVRVAVAEESLPDEVIAIMYPTSVPTIVVDRRSIDDRFLLLMARSALASNMASYPAPVPVLTLTDKFEIHRADGTVQKPQVMRNIQNLPERVVELNVAFVRAMTERVAKTPVSDFEGRKVRTMMYSELLADPDR